MRALGPTLAATWLLLGTALAQTQPATPVKHKPVHKTASHVPVVAPRHPLPRHAAVVAAKKAKIVIKHEPPPAAPKVAAKPAPPPLPADVGTNTGLHLPRYASLKSDEVNMRVGPAERYPVIWTYQRRDLPVRIEREFDIWRLVEDMDGVKGWVHQATLTGRRTFVTIGAADIMVRAAANETSDAVAVLKPGVVGRIKACDAAQDWCQVQVQEYRGWVMRRDLWGIDAGEAVTP